MAGRPIMLTLFAGAILLASRIALADIFAFTDEQGVTHYTNVPIDARYRMVLAAPRSDGNAHAPNGRAALQRVERYAPLIEMAARASGVEPALIRAIMVVESEADPHALSRRGASGLMQLMPDTARHYGVREIFDPEQNIRAGSQYLRDLSDRYGNDLRLVLAAYNAGPAAVDAHGGTVPPVKETIAYLPRVLGIYRQLRDVTRAH